jgi:hypothetical protein
VKRPTIEIVEIPLVPVKMASGQLVSCDHLLPHMDGLVKGTYIKNDVCVLELGAYDGLLGMVLLDSFSLMFLAWNTWC